MFVPKAGLVVGNRYALAQMIGRGGMGEVWRAHDRQLDSACAVKFIVQHLAGDRGVRERFSREAKAAARLRSPHVVQILGVGEVDGIPYLAMELLQGETLLSRLNREGTLSAGLTLQMVEQVAEALEGAHRAGIVHRDLKPDNIWFWSGSDEPGALRERVFVKVLDFGVAKTGLTTESLQTATGALVGTPQYMSPEQALGNRDVDHRSDLWSLAVISVECLSGKRPFDSPGLGDLLLKIVAPTPPPLSAFAPELPASLQGWWSRAVARDPRERFQSATELAESLRVELARLGLVEAAHTPGQPQALPIPLVESIAHGVRGGAAPHPGASGAAGVSETRGEVAAAAPLASRAGTAGVEPGAGALGLPGASGVALPSAAARSPGSVGPTSSSRRQARQSNQLRALTLVAAVVVSGLLVTLVRLWFQEQEQAASPPPAEAATAGSVATSVTTSGEPAAPPRVEASAAPPVRPASEPRIAPVEGSPWDAVLRDTAPASKAGAPESASAALQPRPGAAEKSSRDAEQARPSSKQAPRAGNPRPAPAEAAPEPPPTRIEQLPTAVPTVDGPKESEAARKKRLRDLVGLPKTN